MRSAAQLTKGLRARTILRRHFAAVAAASILGSATRLVGVPQVSSGSGDTPTVVRVGYLPATHHALLFIAKELNLFDARIVDVKAIPFENSVQMLNALKADELDIGMPGVATPAAEIGARAPLSIIGGAAARSAALVAPARLAAELRPLDKETFLRRIAKTRVGAVTGSTGLAVLKQAFANLKPPAKAEVREYTRASDVITAVAGGEVALGLLWSPHMTIAESKGLTIVMWMSEFLDEHVCCRQVARDNFLSNWQATVEYLRGTLRAWNTLQQARKEPKRKPPLLAAVKKYLKTLSDAELEKELFGRDPRTTLSPSLDRRGIERYLDAMANAGLLRPDQCQVVRSKIKSEFMVEALTRLGCSATIATTCIDKAPVDCECLR